MIVSQGYNVSAEDGLVQVCTVWDGLNLWQVQSASLTVETPRKHVNRITVCIRMGTGSFY